MSSGPANAWIVLVGWLGLMAGVGAALRPAPPEALPALEAAAMAADWRPHVAHALPGRPTLFVGMTDCPCAGGADRTLVEWASAENLDVHPAPDRAGIALVDAEGQLRFAGDPSALVVHCGGLRGFRAWWSAPAERPVLTVPCACA